MIVYVLKHDHKHGCDLSVFNSLELAQEAGLLTIKGIYGDMNWNRPGLDEALRNNDWENARRLWGNSTDFEYISIEEYEVQE